LKRDMSLIFLPFLHLRIVQKVCCNSRSVCRTLNYGETIR
jgi:hypothetical protein